MSAEKFDFSRPPCEGQPAEHTAIMFSWMGDYYESIFQPTTAMYFKKMASGLLAGVDGTGSTHQYWSGKC